MLSTFEEHHLFDMYVGLTYAFLGMMFYTFKPYKVNWMNHTDGAIFQLLLFFFLTYILKTKVVYYIQIVFGLSVGIAVSLYLGYKCFRKILS